MPSCLIAEDEPLLGAGLQTELAKAWPALQVVAIVGDGASAHAQTLALRPDICFLDIRMPGLSGLEAAQALAEDWPDEANLPLIVFVTAYDQYAVQAFEAQAVDYILKPWDTPRLVACVARLQARLANRALKADAVIEQLRALLVAGPAAIAMPRLDVIQAQVGATVHMVPINDVVYFEAADKYVRVVTAEREHLIRMSLKELLPQLDAQRFWQVHRGTVVQARCISLARREETGKVTLTLSNRSEKLVASRLYAYLFKGM